MGLDTTHDAWHGAYSSFYTWRCNIWKAAGLPMVPDTERGNRERPSCWDDPYGRRTDYEGYWPVVPDEPLEYVVNHSDCDGYIEPEHCKLVADRLEELLPSMEEDDFGTVRRTVAFIAGCRKAHATNERLEFR